MRQSHILPSLLLGALGGWMARALTEDAALTLTAGDVLSAAVTVAVGWSIQRALQREAELHRVPIEALSRLCLRIEELVLRCIERPPATVGSDSDLVATLQLLSNEVLWLKTMADDLGTETSDRILHAFFQFKKDLTGARAVNLRAASETGRTVRTLALEIQWQISHHLLDNPADITKLARKPTRPHVFRSR